MSRTLDGIDFDIPPTAGQVMALAQLHRKKLDAAIFHKEIHLGEYSLAQRKAVYDFTRQLDENQREQFYKLYNSELVRLADPDRLHPASAESGLSKFAIFLILAITAGMLGSTVFIALFK
ncbi:MULTISPECIES: hypothetical protein [Acinetobacter]|jgi:hypothetical protein|uniref:Uncharacterized protein n=3 Tax=Acinetobacter schindleri TaxID=108981 RepID=N9AFM5_9GAMM|nr:MULTISPECIES: hypothetical protein [Acinetobacter]APX62969.1 hypothetical protein AsACE_CH01572 [Acinetobacter schindleri]AWD68833.1 hypothetical protein C0119_00220 [Acinetobacter schindleri]ENV12839.1 hypothetical protein F965_02205 [Acinetobacter schindleri NIPH 900]ENV44899.1 hypothetical protein F955_01692 [Acinetobacter schindleri CIP 107287]ENX00621.1 hypothetical protein F899_01918 [Acinetobacter sp. CIP 101934]